MGHEPVLPFGGPAIYLFWLPLSQHGFMSRGIGKISQTVSISLNRELCASNHLLSLFDVMLSLSKHDTMSYFDKLKVTGFLSSASLITVFDSFPLKVSLLSNPQFPKKIADFWGMPGIAPTKKLNSRCCQEVLYLLISRCLQDNPLPKSSHLTFRPIRF